MQHNIFPDIKVKVRAHGPHMQRGGGGLRSGRVKSNCNKLRINCGKMRKHCGPVTQPPKASRGNTSAQGTRRAPSHKGDRQKALAKKMREIAGDCEQLRNCENAAMPELHVCIRVWAGGGGGCRYR